MVVVVVEFQYVSTVVEKTSAYTAKESDVTYRLYTKPMNDFGGTWKTEFDNKITERGHGQNK